eukprot:TRINITY_DN3789_c0_g3_i1.p1 TRINITY_DN3789_c0_g3~~TRINITY_DN3789_c0_g3_i1.p1  ORF type:complete len:569 (-),score=103.63 TRINITY_DN3789_c0_g3_i1:108-1814(-)
MKKDYGCRHNGCPCLFKSRAGRLYHEKGPHKCKTPCSYCSEHQDHMRPPKVGEFACAKCPAVFQTRKGWREHAERCKFSKQNTPIPPLYAIPWNKLWNCGMLSDEEKLCISKIFLHHLFPNDMQEKLELLLRNQNDYNNFSILNTPKALGTLPANLPLSTLYKNTPYYSLAENAYRKGFLPNSVNSNINRAQGVNHNTGVPGANTNAMVVNTAAQANQTATSSGALQNYANNLAMLVHQNSLNHGGNSAVGASATGSPAASSPVSGRPVGFTNPVIPFLSSAHAQNNVQGNNQQASNQNHNVNHHALLTSAQHGTMAPNNQLSHNNPSQPTADNNGLSNDNPNAQALYTQNMYPPEARNLLNATQNTNSPTNLSTLSTLSTLSSMSNFNTSTNQPDQQPNYSDNGMSLNNLPINTRDYRSEASEDEDEEDEEEDDDDPRKPKMRRLDYETLQPHEKADGTSDPSHALQQQEHHMEHHMEHHHHHHHHHHQEETTQQQDHTSLQVDQSQAQPQLHTEDNHLDRNEQDRDRSSELHPGLDLSTSGLTAGLVGAAETVLQGLNETRGTEQS